MVASVYVGILERLFNIFLIFLVLICLRCLNEKGNISFDLVGLVLLFKSPINVQVCKFTRQHRIKNCVCL